MSSYKLPEISEISQLSDSQIGELIDNLFEHHSTLHKLLTPMIKRQTETTTYFELIENIREFFHELLISKSNSQDILDIIAAHPRLGPSKKNTPSDLSEHSSAEQKSLNSGSPEEAKQLIYLNERYEKTFPGLRYVVFVNGRSRQVIMENMRQRIGKKDIETEKKLALDAMCDIAADRSKKLLLAFKEQQLHKL